MANSVSHIEAHGVFGRFDFSQELQPGVNIIFGKNGTGKTTLLHILANVLNGDYARFAFLQFESIKALLDDGVEIQLTRRTTKKGDQVIEPIIDGKTTRSISVEEVKSISQRGRPIDPDRLRRLREIVDETPPLLPAAYFPAFRTMIEAWASLPEERDVRVRQEYWEQATLFDSSRRWTVEAPGGQATEFARRLFGDFIPRLNYPSPLEIEARMADEIYQALLTVGRVDRELLSQVFLDVFAAISRQSPSVRDSTTDLLEQIRALSETLEHYPLETKTSPETDVYGKLKRSLDSAQVEVTSQEVASILNIYRNSLKERAKAQEKSFEGIQRYLRSVNDFLEGKQIVVAAAESGPRRQTVRLRFDDTSLAPLRALSSGERQIVTLIYAATHMRSERVILIDEPEISLHVDWQRKLLQNMSEQLQDRQIIACTHSPIVAADYGGRVKDLQLVPSSHRQPTPENSTAEESQEEL